MPEIRKFNGVLDTDTPNAEVNFYSHTDAKNITFRGDGVAMRAQNVFGNAEVPNTNLPSSGNNTCISSYYDQVRERIFSFNYNDEGNHGIYVYDLSSGFWYTLLQNGSNTDGDILNFNLDRIIVNINIIYAGSPTINENDILYFVDILGRPTKINIDRYLYTPYSIVERNYINVIKAPPTNPIQCCYGLDNTYLGNNLKNGLFQFIYRFVYDDNEKSVWSTGSQTPLPLYPNNDGTFGSGTDSKYLNNNIIMYFDTGNPSVRKIEVAFRETTAGATSDYSLIQSFDKTLLSIPDNDIYKFQFYNDAVYTVVDKAEQILLYDYVPNAANAQELLNGSTLIYGGIREGYNNVTVNATVSQESTGSLRLGANGFLFFAENVTNSNTIKIVIDGVTTGGYTPLAYAVYNVYARKYDTGSSTYTDLSFSYSNTNELISSAISGLSAAAVAKGYTVVSTIANELVLSYTGVILCGFTDIHDNSSIVHPEWDILYSLFANASYKYGIVYYDENGKTNGVNTDIGLNLSTSVSGGAYIPPQEISTDRLITINNFAPSWAKYYQIVRSNNLSYGIKALYWVSVSAFSDVDVTVTPNQKYAYIGIDNIYEYNLQIQATQGVVGYEFSPGDRVRFIERYNSVGAPSSSLYNKGYDYEILGLSVNPVMNGIAKTGTFLKIAYPPATDISTDMKFDGTPDYQNYEIFIYNKALSFSADQQIYYEIGEKFNIEYNSSTNQYYHLADNQSQTSSQPAILKINDGDIFYRQRNVTISPSVQIQCVGNPKYSNSYVTWSINSAATPVVTTNYTIGHTNADIAGDPTVYSGVPTWIDGEYNYWNTSAVDYNVRFKFTFSIYNSNGDQSTSIKAFIKCYNSTGTVVTNQILGTQQVTVVNQQYVINVDAIVKIPAGYKSALIFTNDSNVIDLHVGGFEMEITPLNTIPIYVDDYSYSDTYNIETNSNSRPLVIDVNAKDAFYGTLVRWSLGYQQNTNINQTNRFYPVNYDEIDTSRGDIQRFKARDRILRVFQNRACGQYGVYTKYIQNNQGENQLIISSDIITANNIQYYKGEYGLGEQYTGLVSGKIQDYFVDPIRGYHMRLSDDGLVPISELYKGQYYIKSLLSNYNQSFDGNQGGKAKILGVYDYFEEQAHVILQGGTIIKGSVHQTVPDYNFSFNEKRNSYTSFYDFHPEYLLAVEENVYTWKNGKMYLHSKDATYCNFYGTQYAASIQAVFNQTLVENKSFLALKEVASGIWACPVISTNSYSYGTTNQQSNLVESDFAQLEGNYEAVFLRDTNSIGGIGNGDSLKGNYIVIDFQSNNANNLVFLSEISVKFIDSPRNS